MEIIEIRVRRNHLFEIFFNTGNSVLLDKKTVSENGLYVGQHLDEPTIISLRESSDYTRAFSRAVWHLERSSLSRKALCDKLHRAAFPENIIAKVTERLQELGLIDDVALAERLAEKLLNDNISKRQALQKMASRGIDYSLAREMLDNTECDTLSQIRAVIDKKYKNKLSDADSVKRVFAALQRLGFGYSDIREVLKNYSEELKYSEENYGL